MAESQQSGKDSKQQKAGLRNLVQAESMMQLAIAIPAGCLIGWLLGGWADRAWHQQWIAIVGVLLGAAGGFLQLVRVAMRYMKDSN
jgi:ATP synthase protein I